MGAAGFPATGSRPCRSGQSRPGLVLLGLEELEEIVSCQPPGFLLLERRLKGGKQPDADRLLVGLSVGTQSKGGAGEEWSTPPGSEGYPPWHLAPRPSRDPCLDTDGDGAEE
jgi:hypothetical protein